MDLLGWWNPPPPERAKPALTDEQLLRGSLTVLETIGKGGLTASAVVGSIAVWWPRAGFLSPTSFVLVAFAVLTFAVSAVLARRTTPHPWIRLQPDFRFLVGAGRRADLVLDAVIALSIAGAVSVAVLDPRSIRPGAGDLVAAAISAAAFAHTWLAVRYSKKHASPTTREHAAQ